MTRIALPLHTPDLSGFARRLHSELSAQDGPPGHLALMNMLARSAGFRNFQHFRAQAIAADRLEAAPAQIDQPAHIDLKEVDRVRRYFDADARLKSWPAKTSAQHLALWGIWAQIPRAQEWTERNFNAQLNRLHLFGDPAILRRTMVERGMIARQPDGTGCRRIEQPPPAEAVALIRSLTASAR